MLLGILLDMNAIKSPNKKAITFDNNSYTFCEVNKHVNQLSNALRAMGLKRQDSIGIISQNLPQYLECIFACAKINVILVNFNWRLSPEENAKSIDKYNIKHILFSSKCIEFYDFVKNKSCVQQLICLDDQVPDATNYMDFISSYPVESYCEEILADDILLELFTSGTTGEPKGVLLKHSGIYEYMKMYTKATNWDNKVVYQYISPFFHISGLSACISLLLAELWFC